MNSFFYIFNLRYKKIVYCGRVAQLDRLSNVNGYEPGGRRFDSCRVRHIKKTSLTTGFFRLKNTKIISFIARQLHRLNLPFLTYILAVLFGFYIYIMLRFKIVNLPF